MWWRMHPVSVGVCHYYRQPHTQSGRPNPPQRRPIAACKASGRRQEYRRQQPPPTPRTVRRTNWGVLPREMPPGVLVDAVRAAGQRGPQVQWAGGKGGGSGGSGSWGAAARRRRHHAPTCQRRADHRQQQQDPHRDQLRGLVCSLELAPALLKVAVGRVCAARSERVAS